MTENESQFVPLHTLSDRFEADLLLDALRQEGVPALLRPFNETAYSGLFVPQKGWGKILVPKEMMSRAREILAPLMEQFRITGRSYKDTSEIDPVLWERLRQANPEEICRGAAVEFDPESCAYRLRFLDVALLCHPQKELIEPVEPAPHHTLDFQFYLVVLHYLLEAQDEPLAEKWVSEKDLPSGEIFFRGHHGLPLDSLVEVFDPHPDLLEVGAGVLDGVKVDLGDASYRFRALPRVPLLLVFWAGDEEFKPELHMLFDETITLHLRRLDIVFALANVFCRGLLHAIGPGQEVGGE